MVYRRTAIQQSAAILAVLCLSGMAYGSEYKVTALTANTAGPAPTVDADLKSPRGIAVSSLDGLIVAAMGSGSGLQFSGNGLGFPAGSSNHVGIPVSGAFQGTVATPSGVVLNTTADFTPLGGSAPAEFIFVTGDGTISAWAPSYGATAVLVGDNIDQTTGPAYSGAAIGVDTSDPKNSVSRLYVTDFRHNQILVFNRTFGSAQITGTFGDANLPAGFSAFNILNADNELYVSYAKPDTSGRFALANGGGIVDAFDLQGNLLRRVAGGNGLNAPYGMAIAPFNFGQFSNGLMIANTGDGTIQGYNRFNGEFLGQMADATNTPIAISGLNGIAFGNDGSAGPKNRLNFTASAANGDGLLGAIELILVTVSSPATATPQSALVGETVSFSVGFTVENNAAATVVWNFGDGTTATGAVTQHVYTVDNQYQVVATITDPNGNVITSSTNVTISPLPPPPDLFGQNPPDGPTGENPGSNDPANTTPQPTILVLSSDKLSIKLNFAKPGNDAIALNGKLPLPSGFISAGQALSINVGGVTKSFTLDARGNAHAGGDSFRLTFKAKKGIVAAQSAAFTLKLSRGNFAEAMANAGLANADVRGAVDVPVTVLFNGGTYQATMHAQYAAKHGKSGLAK